MMQKINDLRQWNLSSTCFQDIFWRFSILLRTFCTTKYNWVWRFFFQNDFMIVKSMQNKRIKCFFIEDIKKFMIFEWKNIFDHNVRFTMLFEMFFYVSQNDRKKIYVLSFIHHVERWCFDHGDIHFWQFLFRIKDFRFNLNEFKIFNRLRIFDYLDWFCRFFVFSRKINRWLIKTNFEKRILMILMNFLEFLIDSSSLKWFDWFKRDFFWKEMFFFVYCFYSFRMRAEFRIKLDDVRFFIIIDVVFTHSWFI
jgi:hypothetical protein